MREVHESPDRRRLLSGSDIVWRDDAGLSFSDSPLVDAVDPIDGIALTRGERVWQCECLAAYRESSVAFLTQHNNGACVGCGRAGRMRPRVVTTGPIHWTPVDNAPGVTPQFASVGGVTLPSPVDRGLEALEQHSHRLSDIGFGFGIASFFLYVFVLLPILAVVFSIAGLVAPLRNGERGSVRGWIGLVLGSIYTLLALTQ